MDDDAWAYDAFGRAPANVAVARWLSTMSTLSQTDTENLIQISKANGIIWLALFGSLARGEATGASDVDLAVRFGKSITLFDLVGAQQAMEAALGRSVDLIPIDDTYSFVRRSMLKDLIVLYEASSEAIPPLRDAIENILTQDGD